MNFTDLFHLNIHYSVIVLVCRGHFAPFHLNLTISFKLMCGSRKIHQGGGGGGFSSDMILVDEGRGDPNKAKSEPSLTCLRIAF